MTLTSKAIALGLVAGFLAGLFGIGGGLVMVPVMVLWLGIEQHRAHATSVAAVIFTAGAAVIPFALNSEVQWSYAGWVLTGSLTGAYLGARLISRIPAVWLARAFVVLAFVAAGRMILGGSGNTGLEPVGTVDNALTAGALVLVGLIAGAIAASLGIGGGIMYVPALVFLFGLVQQEAQGTSLVIIVPSAIVATVVHTRAGRTNWRVAATVAIGALVGSPLGGEVALGLSPDLLRRLFAIPVTVAALRMLRKTRRQAND